MSAALECEKATMRNYLEWLRLSVHQASGVPLCAPFRSSSLFSTTADLMKPPGCIAWHILSNLVFVTCRVAKFNGVHTLILHIPENFGADHTRITFIGIKGEFTEVS